MAKSKQCVGLDIGSHSVKILQLQETKAGFKLLNFGIALLPPDAIVDGTIMNSSDIVEAIKNLMTKQKIKNKNCSISVSGHSVIVKKISVSQMTQEELDESIQWEAEQYIPFDINDVNIDSEILPQSREHGRMDILLVAAKKDLINEHTAIITEASLNPMVVDVDAFALQNMFEVNYDVNPTDTIVLVNIGASIININVLSGGIHTFSRDISLGGNQFTKEIQKHMNISYEEAEGLKTGGSMGEETQTNHPMELQSIIDSVSDNLASEIQRSLDFYLATSNVDKISKAYICGGSAKIPSLGKIISNKINVPTEVINPFRKIIIDEKQFNHRYIAKIAPMAAVCVGLSLRRADE